MLRYLGYGDRQFGEIPMYVHKRSNWEFFAVLKGRCSPVYETTEPQVLQSSRLWLFPPDVSHGWAGVRSSSCRVAVFHFSTIPHLLERMARSNGHLEIELSPPQVRTIAQLAVDLKPHYERMTEKSLLVFEHAGLELSLLMLETMPIEKSESKSDFALRKVEAGIIWYLEHMTQQPKLEEIAAAVNVSVRHLRRLFREVRSESPQVVFTQLRLQRAMELLAKTDNKMETIAHECGFASNTDFSRVFKKYRGTNPDAWRRNGMSKKSL